MREPQCLVHLPSGHFAHDVPGAISSKLHAPFNPKGRRCFSIGQEPGSVTSDPKWKVFGGEGHLMKNWQVVVLPGRLTWTLKNTGLQGKTVFQGAILKVHVSFRLLRVISPGLSWFHHPVLQVALSSAAAAPQSRPGDA